MNQKIGGLDCRTCSHCLKARTKEIDEYAESAGLMGCDYFCKHPDGELKRNSQGVMIFPIIQSGRYTDYTVKQPDWCPMKKNLLKLQKNMPEVTRKKRNYNEQCEIYKQLTCGAKWEEFRVGEIYHYPPVYSGKRTDFLLERKTDFYLFLREIEKNGKGLGAGKYFYRSDSQYKFLRENKIIKFSELTPP